MKKYILVSAMLIALAMVSCKENPYMPSPGDNDKNSDTIPVLKADTNGIVVSVDSAYAIGMKQANDVPTGEVYKITAYISSIKTDITTIPKKYTNINFSIQDGGKNQLNCQFTNYINNYPFRSQSQVPTVGSKVTVLGALSKYDGTPQMKNGFIMRVDSLAAPAQ